MEPECSLPHSQTPATCPYRDPATHRLKDGWHGPLDSLDNDNIPANVHVRARKHTHKHTLVMTPLNDGSARGTDRFLHNEQQTQKKNIAGFEPAISAIKRLQTHSLDPAATGMGQ